MIVDTHTQEAFFDEMEKIALGIKLVHEPGALSSGLAGKYVTNGTVMRESPALAKKFGVSGTGKDLLLIAPKHEFQRAYPGFGDDAYRTIKQHELVHYMRAKKGKLARVGKPGIRGLASTAREELIAHAYPALRTKSPLTQQALARGIIPGTIASVRSAYPGQSLKSVAAGGTLGRIARLFRR